MNPRGPNKDLMCKIPKHSESSNNLSKQIMNVCEEDVCKILKDLGLALLVDLIEEDKLLGYGIDRGCDQE